MDHADVVSVWAALAAATFPLLFLVSAPYGKLVRGGWWGPEVNGRVGWFLQEIVAPLSLTLAVVRGAGVFTFPSVDGRIAHDVDAASPPPLAKLFIVCWWAHYLNRAVLYPLTRRMSPTTGPVVATAVCFNLVNGALVGAELAHGHSAHLVRPGLRALVGGMALFCAGAGVNITADRTLRRLRRGPEDRGHYVPRGGLFECVTCPHYLGEVMEWTGFAVATQTRAGWAFAFWTFANLLPRAVAYRAWYRSKFGDKCPQGIRAMIPFVW
mmetsp:Transcript_8890/g.14095  ORF Transcript_8890/g.14095 Transcript_8890/m.14095 type:complete len:268 (+) Transcript_8890:36-839(+)